MNFYILGPLKVTSNAEPITIRAERVRAVLAALLLHPSLVVPIDHIVDSVWTKPPRSAIKNVRTYIWHLRSILHSVGDDPLLESHPGGYRLLADPEVLDMLRFTTFAADGRHALRCANFESATMLLRQALELWRGDALTDLRQGHVMRAKVVMLAEQRRRVEFDWISARMALGEHAELVAVLRELTLERPLDEGLWRYLIITLYSMGRTAEALSAYAEARRNLVTELGLEPGPYLQKVHVAILSGKEISEARPRPVYRLAQHTQPRPRQLPVRNAGFAGRQDALSTIRQLASYISLRPSKRTAVVIVSGPPGVGKSATAVAAAHAVKSEFPDGQLYIDVRGVGDEPLGAADALACALDGFGLQPEALPECVDRRRALYRSLIAERKVLILLDNAATASQVAPLIPGQGQSILLVTSQRVLAVIDADLRIDLKPLTEDEALDMLARIIGAERVKAERVEAVAIANACARLPLAIRIVGARLVSCRNYPLWMLRERLNHDGHILDELSMDGLAVRDRFDASYRALDPVLQRYFRLIGKLTPGRITAAALGDELQLSARCADRQLGRLVHEGMLMPGIPSQGAMQYRMLSLLHVYAQERLAIAASACA